MCNRCSCHEDKNSCESIKKCKNLITIPVGAALELECDPCRTRVLKVENGRGVICTRKRRCRCICKECVFEGCKVCIEPCTFVKIVNTGCEPLMLSSEFICPERPKCQHNCHQGCGCQHKCHQPCGCQRNCHQPCRCQNNCHQPCGQNRCCCRRPNCC